MFKFEDRRNDDCVDLWLETAWAPWLSSTKTWAFRLDVFIAYDAGETAAATAVSR